MPPFLFTIIAEALGAVLTKAKESGLISRFEAHEAHGGGEAVTHLQFADDKILFTSTWRE